VIFDAIVVMLAEVDGGDWLGQTSM
jgi:hypothetical protein